MNTNRRNQNQNPNQKREEEESKPIPYTRRGLNEDDQKRITNTDGNGGIENSSDYISTTRQDKKVSREPEHCKK